MNPISRRRFLGQATCAGFSLTGLLSTVGTLRPLRAPLSPPGLPPGGGLQAIFFLLFFPSRRPAFAALFCPVPPAC